MDISGLLRDHVYTAIILGGLVEGETTVVLAGYAAHQGYVAWWAVASLSALVNFMLDQTWFLLGRWRGECLLARSAFLRRGVAAITPRLHQHRRWLVFSVRFLYGLRTAGPVAMGIARVPWLDFVIFNALGSVVWAGVFTALGYAFGQTITVIMGEVIHYEALVVAVIAAGGLAGWLCYRHRRAT